MMLGSNTDSNAKRFAVVNADRLARKRRAPMRRYYTPQDLMRSRREGILLDKETCSTNTSSRSGFKISWKQLTFGLSVIALTLMFFLCNLTELDTLDGERRRLQDFDSARSLAYTDSLSMANSGEYSDSQSESMTIKDSQSYSEFSTSEATNKSGDDRLKENFCGMILDYITKDPNEEGLAAIYKAQFPKQNQKMPEVGDRVRRTFADGITHEGHVVSRITEGEDAGKYTLKFDDSFDGLRRSDDPWSSDDFRVIQDPKQQFKDFWNARADEILREERKCSREGNDEDLEEDCRAKMASEIFRAVLTTLFEKFASKIEESNLKKESTVSLGDIIKLQTPFLKELKNVTDAFLNKDLGKFLDDYDDLNNYNIKEVSPTKSCPSCRNDDIIGDNKEISFRKRACEALEKAEITQYLVNPSEEVVPGIESRDSVAVVVDEFKLHDLEECEVCQRTGLVPGKYAKFGYFFRVLKDRVVILQSLIDDISKLSKDAIDMISLKNDYAGLHKAYLREHYGSELYKAPNKFDVTKELTRYTINFEDGVMKPATSGYVFLKLAESNNLELCTTKLDESLPLTKTPRGDMCQPIAEAKSGDFQSIYNEVGEVIPYLNYLMEEFAKSVNSEKKLELIRLDGTNVATTKIDIKKPIEVQTAPAKSQVRIFEKTGIKYNYDFRRVLDEARGSFICQDMKEVNGVYFTFAKFLEARGCRILRVKNRFMDTCGKSDYADILLNVEINDTSKMKPTRFQEHTPEEFKGTFLGGTIAEVQIHIKAFKIIKKKNHKIYAKFRAIPGSAEAVAKIALADKNTKIEVAQKQKESLGLLRQNTSLSEDDYAAFARNWEDINLSELNLADTEDDPDFDSLEGQFQTE